MKAIIFIVCWLAPFISYSQEINLEKREVIEDRPLRWSDFRGQRYTDTFAAIIYTDIGWTLKDSIRNKSFPQLITTAYFLPNQSAANKKFLMQNPDSIWKRVMHHEQGHYNITRIAAKELQLIYHQFKFDPKNYAYQADTLCNSMRRKINTIQKIYDTESNHSRNHAMQAKWDKLIEEGMKAGKLPE